LVLVYILQVKWAVPQLQLNQMRDQTGQKEWIRELDIDVNDIRLLSKVDGKYVVVDRVQVSEWSGEPDNRFDPGTAKVRNIPLINQVIDGDEMIQDEDDPFEEEKKANIWPGDTDEDAFKTTTFFPSLAMPPFDPSIIDDLRNKYSKFRTRHSEEFLLKMMEVDERQTIREKAKELLTPGLRGHNQQEHNKIGRAQTETVLHDDVLIQLGDAMSKKMNIKQNPGAASLPDANSHPS